jgi:hypothetical protein
MDFHLQRHKYKVLRFIIMMIHLVMDTHVASHQYNINR